MRGFGVGIHARRNSYPSLVIGDNYARRTDRGNQVRQPLRPLFTPAVIGARVFPLDQNDAPPSLTLRAWCLGVGLAGEGLGVLRASAIRALHERVRLVVSCGHRHGRGLSLLQPVRLLCCPL